MIPVDPDEVALLPAEADAMKDWGRTARRIPDPPDPAIGYAIFRTPG